MSPERFMKSFSSLKMCILQFQETVGSHRERARMDIKSIYFIKSVSLHLPDMDTIFYFCSVGKYEFFAVNSTTHFKLLLSWLSSKFFFAL